ncbi:MAG: alpha/beta hydrolase [Tepidisphaeraceae bacterium]
MDRKRLTIGGMALALLAAGVASAQSGPTDLKDVKTVRLWPGDAPATQPVDQPDAGERINHRPSPGHQWLGVSHIEHPWLAVMSSLSSDKVRPAVIICPGGGYAFESMSAEGFDVAQKFDAEGVAAFVLKYRLPHGQAPAADALPAPQQDVLRAIQLVRSRAAEWHIDPKRIGVVGFSAGGHVAATAATMYADAKQLPVHDAIAEVSARPDFAVLMYPVISMRPGVGHRGSRDRLIGKDADAAISDRFSTELHVTPQTPPLFVAQAKDDRTVPYWNAELITQAAEKAGVPHKLVSFDKGGHGFGSGDNAETKTWFAKCIDWLRSQNLLEPAGQ